MTPEELAANADAVQAALSALGVTPQDAYRLEGEQRARERFSRAMQVATERGEASRIEAINARIARDAETHARRETARMSRQGMPLADFQMQGFNPRPAGMQTPDTLTGQEAAPMPSPVSLTMTEASRDLAPALGDRWARPGEHMTGRPLLPQNPLEAAEQDERNQALATAYRTIPAVGMAALAPEMRAAQGVVQGARWAAGTPAGQWVAGQVARNPLMAGGAVAGTATLAAPGQASDEAPLQTREPAAMRALEAIAPRQAALEKARADLDARATTFDSIDWTKPNTKQQAAQDVQTFLIGQGIDVETDGKPGPKTRAAVRAYRENELQRLKAQQEQLNAERASAEGNLAEARRLDTEAYASRRLKELNEPSALEEWAPVAGFAGGMLKGTGERLGIEALMRLGRRHEIGRANALLGQVGQGTVPDRAARMNQFATEGGSRNPPFPYTPGANPYPYTAAPDVAPRRGMFDVTTPRDPAAVMPAARLYQPRALETYGPSAGIAGMGGYELHTGNTMLEDAHKELQTANEALAAPGGLTEANMRRQADARNAVTRAEFVRGVGRGEIGGALLGQEISRAVPPTARPDIWKYESERGAVDMLLRGRNPTPPQIPPPGPHQPGITSYRDPASGSVRRLIDTPRGPRWHGPQGNGRSGFVPPPPVTWDRTSEAPSQPTNALLG